MKYDELKPVCYIDAYSTMPVYCAREVDAAIAELKDENERLSNALDVADATIEKQKADNERLKGESCKLTDGCLRLKQCRKEKANLADELRATKRALWLARAEWARSSALSYHLIESHPDKDAAATYKRKANIWERAKDKCLKKAEEYK